MKFSTYHFNLVFERKVFHEIKTSSAMNWDAISAITGIVAFILTLFTEWPRIKTRWLELAPIFKPPFLLIDRFKLIAGFIILGGILLIIFTVIWPQAYLYLVGRLFFAIGCFGLGYVVILKERLNAQEKVLHSDKQSKLLKPTTKLTTIIAGYLILFGVVAGTLTIWDLIQETQKQT